MLLQTSEERIALLKKGYTGQQIEELYVWKNQLKFSPYIFLKLDVEL